MGYIPLPATNPCPNCGNQPAARHRIMRGVRAECLCGVCGPFSDDTYGALILWRRVAGEPPKPTPPHSGSGASQHSGPAAPPPVPLF